MHLSEILITELAELRKRAGKEKVDIVETGSIRGDSDNYRENDGWSTVTFATEIKEHGGSMTSIDLNTAVADKVLRSKKLRSQVTLIEGHSIDVLSRMDADSAAKAKTRFDVAFLDSDNDGELIFREFMLVTQMMRSPGLIVIDDVDTKSEGVVKGHLVMPWVEQQGISHRLITRTGDGYSTGVLFIDV